MITKSNDRKVEIVGPFKHIQIRDTEIILEDGEEIARKQPQRFVVGPLDPAPCDECQKLKDVYHTPDLIKAFLLSAKDD